MRANGRAAAGITRPLSLRMSFRLVLDTWRAGTMRRDAFAKQTHEEREHVAPS